MIIYDFHSTYHVSNSAINIMKKGRIGMFILSAIFLVFGIYSLQSNFFEDDLLAYMFICIGVLYMLMGLILYPFLIKRMERNLERHQYKQE